MSIAVYTYFIARPCNKRVRYLLNHSMPLYFRENDLSAEMSHLEHILSSMEHELAKTQTQLLEVQEQVADLRNEVIEYCRKLLEAHAGH